eukprot:Opistho-1_new@42293
MLWNYINGNNVALGPYTEAAGLVLERTPIFFDGTTRAPSDGIKLTGSSTAARDAGIVLGSLIGMGLATGAVFLVIAWRGARQRELEEKRLLKQEADLRRVATLEAQVAHEADVMKSAFLANMSHEIRSPLNGLLGIVQIMEDDAGAPLDGLATIRKCGESLMLILNDILDFSKLDANEMTVASVPFDVIERVEDAVSLHFDSAALKSLDISFHVCCACKGSGRPCGPSPVRCCQQDKSAFVTCADPSRFTQVLSNLISNAIKFSDSGSITVCASVVERRDADHVTCGGCVRHAERVQSQEWAGCLVALKEGDAVAEASHVPVDGARSLVPPELLGAPCYKGGRFVLVEVHDTGIGIPTELAKVFSRFQQGDLSLTKKYQGTGLGLSISAHLMRLMGGEIGVRSAVGKGSVFWCVLPLTSIDAQPVPRAPRVSHASATPASVTPPTSSRIATPHTPERESVLQSAMCLTSRVSVAVAGCVVAVGRTPFLDTVGTCAHLMGLPFEGHEVSSVASLSQACERAPTRAIVAIEWDAWILAGGCSGDELSLPEGVWPVIFSARTHGHFQRLPVTREKLRLAIVRRDRLSSTSLVSPNDARSLRCSEDSVCVRPPVTSSTADGAIEVSLQDAPDHAEALPSAIEWTSANATLLHCASATGEVKRRDVLVVEDNAVNRAIVVRIVTVSGATAVSAENGQYGFDLYAAEPSRFGLVLMDLQMPVVGGIEATRMIRALEEERGLRRVPIFALTASTDANVEDLCWGAGMDGFIAKPFRKADLDRLIARTCVPKGGAASPQAQ